MTKVPIPVECRTTVTDSEVVCREKGRKMRFLNPARTQIDRVSIDECRGLRESLLDPKCKLCDFLVLSAEQDEHFVELKGKNVEHAIKQLASTIPQISGAYPNRRVWCWVITTESPAASPSFLVKKARFEKQFKARLSIKTNEGTFTFMPVQ